MFRFLFIVLTFLSYSISKAQTIQGTISYEKGAVPFVSVLLKKTSSPDLIYQFANSNDRGFYEIKLNTALDSVYVEISSVSFDAQRILLTGLQNKKMHLVNLQVFPKTTELQEVIVESKQPIRVKNDTTTYNPDAFKDGTERVVEDLIKKLPGISVEENGEIKFKGKSIKKFLLDGDDLFDSQYVIGSKNINVDMVDKVQGLENFNENKLLKGLTSDEDVALNIVLKKGKTDVSGNAKLSYGIKEKYDIAATTLLVNKKLKGFGILSYNNMGDNPSPYDFDSSTLSVDQMKDEKLLAPQIVSQGNFSSTLNNQFHLINNNFYANGNLLYKVSPKITSKINLGIYDDRFKRTNTTDSRFNIENENITTSETENLIKKPRLYNANLQILNNVSESLSLEYLAKVNYEETNYESISRNNEVIQNNKVYSRNFFIKQNLNLTKRINENSAFLGNVLFSKNNAPQKYVLSPGILIAEDNSIAVQNKQSSRFEKQNVLFNAEYFIKNETSKLKFFGGYSSIKNNFNSQLSSVNEIDSEILLGSDFYNHSDYDFEMPYFGTGFAYFKNKFGFSASVMAQHYSFLVIEKNKNTETKETNFVLAPSLKFQYKFNRTTMASANYSYNEVSPNERNLFSGIVLTGYRSFQNNIPDLRFLETHSYSINFNYNNLFNLESFQITAQHNYRKNNYFSRNEISQNKSIYTQFLLDTGNKDYRLNVNGEKFIYLLKTNLQLNSSYSISQSKNMVNDFQLRNIENRSFLLNATARTGFLTKLNFENKITYANTVFLLENQEQNKFSTLTNTFKTIYKAKENIKFHTVLNFISPDLSINNNYWFLDAELRFMSKNKKFDYSIMGRNLTNNKMFETISITDYSKTVSSHTLINRFVMASFSFNF